MVAGAIAGNISAEATTPTGNSFAEAMRGLRTRRTLGDIYREAKAGRLRMSPYRAIAGPVSLVLMVVGVYLAISGD
jgi:hypothetical protein